MAPESLMFNPDKQPDEEEKKEKIKRRAFIAGGIAMAGAGIYGVGKIISSPDGRKAVAETETEGADTSDLPPREIVEDSHVYESGDEIKTPIGIIKTQGWKVMMGQRDLAFDRWKAGSGTYYYACRIKNAAGNIWQIYNTAHEPKFVFPPGSKEMELKNDPNIYDGFYVDPESAALVTDVEILEYPGEKANLERELLAEDNELKKIRKEHRRQPSHSYRYKLKLKGFTSPEEKSAKRPRVFAEGYIPPKDLSKLGALHQLFSQYRPVPPIYIYGESKNDPYWKGETRSAKTRHQDPLYNRIALANQDFSQPEFPGQGEQVAVHEMSHGILHGSELKGEQFKAYNELDGVWKQLANTIKFDDDVEQQPIFSTLREYNYYGDKKAKKDALHAGHPWSNSNELFASTLTVFRYYATDFIKKLGQLDPESKKLVALAGQKTLAFLRSMNPDEKILKHLIPEVKAIESAIQQ